MASKASSQANQSGGYARSRTTLVHKITMMNSAQACQGHSSSAAAHYSPCSSCPGHRAESRGASPVHTLLQVVCGHNLGEVPVSSVHGLGAHAHCVHGVGLEATDVRHCVGADLHALPLLHLRDGEHVVVDSVPCDAWEVGRFPAHLDGRRGDALQSDLLRSRGHCKGRRTCTYCGKSRARAERTHAARTGHVEATAQRMRNV